MSDFLRKLDEVSEYLDCIKKADNKDKNDCLKYDFGWRFCAAVNNIRIKICGKKKR